MIGGFEARGWIAAVIVLVVAVGVIRLLLWQRSAPAQAKASQWRLALLIILQLTTGVLLHLTLFPPSAAMRSGALVVATGGAPETIIRRPEDTLVALPEAGAVEGAVRVPDLATALRRFPGAARIRVEGNGLPARDQSAVDRPLDFDPPPRPRGLVDLAFPGWTAPGGRFSVGGQVGSLAAGTVELIDPAGVVVDRVSVVTGRRFVLASNARAAGLALFSVRLRDSAGALVEQVAAPLETRAEAQPRVLVLAGAPSAETKYLRRWAEDAGIDLDVQIEVGAGLQLGDASVPLTRAALGKVDLLVIDDRRWETLGPVERTGVSSAIDGGLGLLLRPTSPLSAATRRDWAVLGAPLTGGQSTLPLRLASPGAEDAQTGLGATSDAEPELARRDVGHEGPRAVSMLRDAEGVALASWRTRGSGRVGVWTVADSYALVLTGRSDRYGEVWSELFSTLARPGDGRPVRVEQFARAGARLAICDVAGLASVVEAEGAVRALQVDPATGEHACAAYWPDRSGWHLVRDGAGRETAFYVHPASAGVSMMTFANREATIALATTAGADRRYAVTSNTGGSPWPWFTALLFVMAMLWWLERNRGRAANGFPGKSPEPPP